MSTCVSCNSYYRLDIFHNDPYNCVDCAYVLPESLEDEEDITEYLPCTGRILPVFNETDSNDFD